MDEGKGKQNLQNIISSIKGLNLTILESITELVFLLDSETFEILFANHSVEKLSGFRTSEILGKNKYETFSKNFLELYTENAKNFIASKDDFARSEEYIRSKNNEIKLLYTKKYKVSSTASKDSYILEIASDFTDNHQNYPSLLSAESPFFKLFHSSSIASAIINFSNLKIIDFNQAFINTFGYKEDELKDASFLEYDFLGANIDEFEKNLEKISKAQKEEQREFSITNKNGEKISRYVFIEHFAAKNDTPLLIFTAQSTNGAGQKENEKESMNLIFRSRLISMLSHEFRTPLTTIMLSSDMLKNYGMQWDEEKKLVYFKKISDTVLHLNQLIEKLLTISSIESGQFEFHPESIDVPAFFQSIVENITFTMKSKHQVKFKYSGNYSCALVDENLLSLIVSNLITNAIKYSQENEEVSFDSYCDGVCLTIQIKDRGIGIPAEGLNNLFHTFYRASNVGKRSGFGLGLAIVKKCVEAHRGEIFVNSETGIGTTFTVIVPVTHDRPQECK